MKGPAQPAIGVLVLPALPGVVRFRKEHGRVRIPLDHPPERELAPAVIRDGLVFECRAALESRMHRIGRAVRHEVGDGIQARVHVRQYASSTRTLDGIAFSAGHRTLTNSCEAVSVCGVA